MLDWMDKTHKTVCLLSKSLREPVSDVTFMKKVPGTRENSLCSAYTLRLNYVNYPGQGNFPARTCACLTQARVSCGPQSAAWWKPGMEIYVPIIHRNAVIWWQRKLETVYVSSPAKLHDVFEFQHSSWFPPPAAKRPLWHRGIKTFNKVFAFVWTVLLVTLAVCVRCVCNLLKFQPELCFTWRILRFGKVRKLSKFTKWSTTSAILQW